MAIPAAADQDPANVANRRRLSYRRNPEQQSRLCVGLMPGDGACQPAPSVTHDGDADLWIAQFSIPSRGRSCCSSAYGPVVVGFGPEV